MIIVIGNNITSLFLCAFFEQKKIEYKRLYTHEIVDFTFYFNDSDAGMMKKAMDKLNYQETSCKEKNFKIRTANNEYTVGGSIDNLINDLQKKYHDIPLEHFGEVIKKIGIEWWESIDHNFEIKLDVNSAMVQNCMKSYKSFLEDNLADEELRNLFLSLVPRPDISLNTASGYIVNQIFDMAGKSNKIEEFVMYIIEFLKKENQIKIPSFEEIRICKEKKNIYVNSDCIKYDAVVKSYSDMDAGVRLATFYVENQKKDLTYVFLSPSNMYLNGIQQIILWQGKKDEQLDVYFSPNVTEAEIRKYVSTEIPYLNIKETILYSTLKEQHGCGNFAGWAFNCKENMRNPMLCSKADYIDLSQWGNAHFTSALLALNCLERNEII